MEIGRRDDGVDVLLAAPGLGGDAELVEVEREVHPRVVRASAHWQDIRVFEDPSAAAVVILGQGLALRTEVAVDEAARGRGLARRGLVEARRLVGPDQALFAQTAPGNAASLRAFMSAGFRPIGSEVLFFAGEPPPGVARNRLGLDGDELPIHEPARRRLAFVGAVVLTQDAGPLGAPNLSRPRSAAQATLALRIALPGAAL
jgi:GNAT superfamily N-acetyltransferase